MNLQIEMNIYKSFIKSRNANHYSRTLLTLRFGFILILPYVHVLGLLLAHVAVITLSEAPIAGYKLTFFSR